MISFVLRPRKVPRSGYPGENGRVMAYFFPYFLSSEGSFLQELALGNCTGTARAGMEGQTQRYYISVPSVRVSKHSLGPWDHSQRGGGIRALSSLCLRSHIQLLPTGRECASSAMTHQAHTSPRETPTKSLLLRAFCCRSVPS